MRGMSSWLKEVSINVHSIEGAGEYDVCGAAIANQYLSDGPALDVGFDYHGIGVGIAVKAHVFLREGYWHV